MNSLIDRRDLLRAGAIGTVGLGFSGLFPAWAQSGALARKGSDVLSGERMTMTVNDAAFRTGARHGPGPSASRYGGAPAPYPAVAPNRHS